MPVQLGKLVSLILLEQFGETVSTVGYDLYLYGSRSISYIVHSTKLSPTKVKESLRTLNKHKLLVYEPRAAGSNIPEYELLTDKVLLLLRSCKYLYIIKERYGDEGERLMEDVLKKGVATASGVIIRCFKQMNASATVIDLPTLRDRFSDLVKRNYLVRCPTPASDDQVVPTFILTKQDIFKIPNLEIKELAKLQQGKEGNPGDTGIYWVPNYDKFHQDVRDRLLVTAMERRIDPCAGEVMKCLLELMFIHTNPGESTSVAIQFQQLKQMCEDNSLEKFPDIVKHLNQYLQLIEQDNSNFLSKIGDSGGGQYIINMKRALEQLVWACASSYIVERFNSKAARIFRVIQHFQFMEQEDIQKRAMIPDREAKQLTYELLELNFIKIQTIRKNTGSQGVGKSFHLFHIDLFEVAQVMLDLTYKSLYNVMVRRNEEARNNSRLLHKQVRVENIVNVMKSRNEDEDNIRDLEETITPAERETLASIKKAKEQLMLAEFKLDETLLILQLYLHYKKNYDS